MLKNQTATGRQLSDEQLYRLDIERVRLVNNIRVRSVFVARKQGLFQVPAAVLCDSFCVSTSFKDRFVDVLAYWLFAPETPLCSFNIHGCGTVVKSQSLDI